MVDVKEDFTIDPNEVAQRISSKTKAIIAVDLGGLPCDYDALINIVCSDKYVKYFEPNNENHDSHY